MAEPSKTQVSRIVESAFRSGAVNPKMTIEDVVKLGGGIEEVAGYVLAWERYVLVVAKDNESDIIFRGR